MRTLILLPLAALLACGLKTEPPEASSDGSQKEGKSSKADSAPSAVPKMANVSSAKTDIKDGTDEASPAKQDSTDPVYIKEGSVYLRRSEAADLLIALGTEDSMGMDTKKFYIGDKEMDGHLDLRRYQKAVVSSNGRFIYLEAWSWERDVVDVYDIENATLHVSLDEKSFSYGVGYHKLQWLSDNRLSVLAYCDGGDGRWESTSCKLMQSVDSAKPWRLQAAGKETLFRHETRFKD
jgi:hypothetical protein